MTPIEKGQRIPQALQEVFLASNRGENVDVAPPNSMATKFFGRVGMMRRPSVAWREKAPSDKESGGWGRALMRAKPVEAAPHISNSTTYREPPLERLCDQRPSNSEKPSAAAVRGEQGLSPMKNNAGAQRTVLTRSPSKQTRTTATASSPTKSPSKRSTSMTTPMKSPSKRIATISPQDYLNSMMRNRGYDVKYYHTLDTGFYKEITELQIASNHPRIIEMAQNNPSDLVALICTGLSANPCNSHGESLLHSVCRKRNLAALQVLIECGSDLLVTDDYGRTPLHDACWNAEPDFDVIDTLLTHDVDGPRFLFHTLDRHGGSPLSYVDKTAWHAWLCYLEARKDTYWPAVKTRNEEESLLFTTLMAKPKSLQVAQPSAVLPPRIAMDVVSGRITPAEAMLFVEIVDDDDSSDSSWMSEDNSSSSDDDDDTDFSMSEEEEEGDDKSDEMEDEDEAVKIDDASLESSAASSMDIGKGDDSTESTSDDGEAYVMKRCSSWGGLNLLASPPHHPGLPPASDLDSSWGGCTLGGSSSLLLG